MNISSATLPYLLNTERSEKNKAAYGQGFSDVLEKAKSESDMAESNINIAVNKIDNVKNEEDILNPSYTVTDEEAEYFREKYGEEYDKEDRFKLFAELAYKNIISKNDADVASRKNTIGRIIGGPPPEFVDRMIAEYGYCTWGNAKVVWENVEYGDSYEKYKEQNDMPINTWQDYVQDNYNYYRYIRDTDDVLFKADGNTFTSEDQRSFDSYCEMTLRVQSVLDQIFGG